ncbi:MAG: class I SAM-dependent methyltransferase [archaeon]|nr:class I SAM-dependent methyltransferase [archaeon]
MAETYIEDFRRLWDDRAESYSRSVQEQIENGSYRGFLDEVLKDLPADKTLDVLDIGSGPGFFSVVLGKLGHRVLGIDYNTEMRKEAENNCATYGVPADFHTMDAQNLDLEERSFDLIVSRDVLWNLDDPAKAYDEMFRVLRPGGKIVVFDGNYYLYAHDDAYADRDVEKHIEMYHKDEPDCRERLLRVADMAVRLPASRERRPQWDLSYLIGLGASKVSAVSYPEEEVVVEENGKKVHLPFTFAVSCFKRP